MKLLLAAVICAVVIGLLFRTASHSSIPEERDLQEITGTIINIKEVAGRYRLKNGYVVVSVKSDEIIRELVSYDKKLLAELKLGVTVRAGVSDLSGDSEIWTIATNTNSVRSFEQTVSLRSEQLKNERHRLYAMSLAIATWFSIMYFMSRKNPAF